jgi:serine/threonine protein kinase
MIGRVVKGKYKIYDEVGAGGFATVYLGRNMDTNEIVAIKVLSEQFIREPRYVERFRR